jgi:hypothetical protein
MMRFLTDMLGVFFVWLIRMFDARASERNWFGVIVFRILSSGQRAAPLD